MTVLFPNHPLKSRSPDPDYAPEFEAAKAAGFQCEVFDLESLRQSDVNSALRPCADAETKGETLVHRCWMMSEQLYVKLHEGLLAKCYGPVTSQEQYAEAHYLPHGYAHLAGRTPESSWMTGRDENEAWALYQRFTDADAIIKDWVKSAKHKWKEACFIPAQTTRERFSEILHHFLEARGDLFEKGIVIRRFHPLVCLGVSSHGQPIHDENRMFFLDGTLLASTPGRDGSASTSLLAEWEAIARKFKSRFITMDVAREEKGGWIIIEVGDGGVSGLPDSIDTNRFYRDLFTCMDA